MINPPTESQFEETNIERLQRLGYHTQYGGEIERPLHTVVLPDLLHDHLGRRYPHLPDEAIEQAILFNFNAFCEDWPMAA
jgi:hypothetical protein